MQTVCFFSLKEDTILWRKIFTIRDSCRNIEELVCTAKWKEKIAWEGRCHPIVRYIRTTSVVSWKVWGKKIEEVLKCVIVYSIEQYQAARFYVSSLLGVVNFDECNFRNDSHHTISTSFDSSLRLDNCVTASWILKQQEQFLVSQE